MQFGKLGTTITKTAATLTLLGCLATAQAQQITERMHPIKPGQVYINNALLHTGFSALNALIKKEPVGKAIIKGVIGSTISTTAQHMVAQNKDLAWPAKLINSAGRSFTHSAMTNTKPFSYIAMDLGPLDLTYSTTEHTFRPRLLFVPTLEVLMQGINDDATFDATRSLKYGTPIFTQHEFAPTSYYNEVKGITNANIITFDNNYEHINGVVELQLANALQYAARIPLGHIMIAKGEDGLPSGTAVVNNHVGIDALTAHYFLDFVGGMFSTDYTKFQHVWSYSLTDLTPPSR